VQLTRPEAFGARLAAKARMVVERACYGVLLTDAFVQLAGEVADYKIETVWRIVSDRAAAAFSASFDFTSYSLLVSHDSALVSFSNECIY
jgi:hypothetical protein